MKMDVSVEFRIFEGQKVQIERVNINGNTVTNDFVVRSGLYVDEGDPYNKVKLEKSISNLKSMNIFNSVNYKVLDGSEPGLKVIDISIEEKPTGEISAGAGYGTEGGAFAFSVKENNYLGKGLRVSANANVTSQSVRGGVNIVNPNYNFTIAHKGYKSLGKYINNNKFKKIKLTFFISFLFIKRFIIKTTILRFNRRLNKEPANIWILLIPK